MSAVSVFSVAPRAAGRVVAARRASRSSAFVGAESKRPLMTSSSVSARPRGAVAAMAVSDFRDSPIVRANNGATPAREPVADVSRVTATFARVVQTLWNARKGFAAIAFAVALALVDAGAAVAGRGGGRSGGRMGGSSFRSTSRSMGTGMGGGMGGMGGAAAMGPGTTAATGAGAGYGPRVGLGMPSFFFMPSFGYGYGYGMGGGFIMMKVIMQLFLLYMVYSFIFGGGMGSRGAGGNARP
jgi:hypothetical protein